MFDDFFAFEEQKSFQISSTECEQKLKDLKEKYKELKKDNITLEKNNKKYLELHQFLIDSVQNFRPYIPNLSIRLSLFVNKLYEKVDINYRIY